MVNEDTIQNATKISKSLLVCETCKLYYIICNHHVSVNSYSANEPTPKHSLRV